MSKNYYLFYLCYVLSFFGSTQITIDNNTYTPTQLVDGVLIPSASGTVVSNISFGGVLNNSNRYQLGYFSTATSTLSDMGFSEGIVMSTGNTSDIPLALGTNPGSVAQIGTNFVSCTAGEIRKTGTCGTFVNDLNILSGGANYYNAAILEFDFIPANDFVQFRYVFGSEEYEDDGGFINYQCTEYNDRFGFLISGPGIAAGQGFDNDAENIATLANGSFVGINSVNNGVVGSSAVPNGSSFCQGVNPGWVQNSPSPEFGGIIDGTQLNGNTMTLTAFRNNLIPGQTYHIKLLLTDVSDGTYDAVVYLEAGSFITQNSCSIMNITAGVQTPCDPATNTYTQEVTLTYTNPPSTGNLVVNGQTFAIGTSPQTIVLTGLTSDGLGVDVTASFDADPICSLTELDLFTAPVDCTPTPCGISAITAGVQTPCDPATNTYTQEVTLTYTNPPSTGNLVVNGQTFAIGTSPQTIVLTGLTSDGLGVDVTASFDADPSCSLTELDLFTAPVDCTPTPCGISSITAGVQTPCDPATNIYTQEVILTYTNPPSTGNLVVNGQTFAIGTSPQTIVLTGLTSDGLGVDVTASFDADPSCSLTELDLFTAPVDCTPTPCGISAITAGVQTPCDPATNTYTQEVILTYTNPPSTGNLVVNGQTFAIGTSPQTIVLTGLTSDGLGVDVTASFDADPSCSLTELDLFTAPVDCTPTPCGISAITAGVQTPCDPATNTYTQEVTLTYTNPPSTGNLVVNGQTFAIGTSPQTIVLTGLTSDGLGVDVTASFDADPSCSLTELDLFTAPVDCTPTPCILDSIQFYAQSNCHPVTNTYDEELVIFYSNQPDSGYLIVNGQAFLIENSPQNILLTDLEADGGFVDVDIIVSSDSTALDTLCQLFVADFFEAAADCYLECGDFYVPEAFSPNGDGNNDVFTGRIFEECVKDFDLRIFNRWGEVIFHSESIYNAWDGTFKGKYAEEGVYVYKIELLLLEEFDPTLYSGNIQLIR